MDQVFINKKQQAGFWGGTALPGNPITSYHADEMIGHPQSIENMTGCPIAYS